LTRSQETGEGRGYWPQPWTCEDGGPRRWGLAGVPGLDIQPGEGLQLAAIAEAFATDAIVRREPGELFALRHDVPMRRIHTTPVSAWAERLDPESLAVTARTPPLPGGPFWPGGIAAHASGDLHLVFGRWAHRLSLRNASSSRAWPGCRTERPWSSPSQ